MAFTYIPEYSGSDAALNIDVKGVSIAENFPAANINNAMRAMLQQEKQELATLASVASAGTVDITSAGGFTVSGTTTITAFTVVSGSRRVLHFQGALTLTHNGTSLILPGGANITTAAGDCLSLVAVGTNQVRVTSYMRADGTYPVWGSAATVTAASGDLIPIKDVSDSDAPKFVTAATVAALATGKFVNRFSATPYTTNADLTTTIPLDDTTPTSSEGTEILTVAVTTTTDTQIVRLRFQGLAAGGASDTIIWAIFRGTTCIQACSNSAGDIYAGTWQGNVGSEVEDTPGTAGAYTYTVRIGGNTGTIRMNGSLSARYFGGTAKATLIADLIEP